MQARARAHNVTHYVWMVAFAEHADLLLDVKNLLLFCKLNHLDGNKFPSLFVQSLIDRAIGAPTWQQGKSFTPSLT